MKKPGTTGFREGTLQSQVMSVLRDKRWHCRECEYENVPSNQLAGGGGIQGLQRGTKSRPGIVIDSRTDRCPKCNKKTRQDRWTGETQSASAAAGISPTLVEAVLLCYDYTDAIEQRRRPRHELVIDHRFPMLRWGAAEEAFDADSSHHEIRRKFQLLKKDASGNHNLLKSRDCENCSKTGQRGTPFGIVYFYEGGQTWDSSIPHKGSGAEKGCRGCGWYDFDAWRRSLNAKVR